MAVTREQLQEDLPWDVERIPVGIGEHASDRALNLLNKIEGSHVSVERVTSYARRGGDGQRVATDDLLRMLQHADGRLALVTWSSGGITSIGYLPDEQRYDVGQFSGLDERMGRDPKSYEKVTRGKAKELLKWTEPTVVCRSESKLLDETEVTA